MNLSVKRYKNVLNADDFDVVQRLISRKEWTIHQSKEDSVFKFFMAPLSHVQTNNFLPKISSFVKEYLTEHEYKGSLAFERAYINCHPAYHPGDWHTDSPSGITILYYPPTDVDFGTEGGTDIKDHGYEQYIPNSLLVFPGSVEHMATQHTKVGTLRFSIVFKFNLVSS